MIKSIKGFTLLELVIALGIFALVWVMVFSGYRAVLTTSTQVEQVSKELSKLQMVFNVIGRDIQQSIARSIRDDFGDTKAAFVGAGGGFGNMLEFTRAGVMNPLGRQRSHLQRIAYGVKEENLVRLSWPVLDRVQGMEPREAVLLEGIKAFELRFLKLDSQWATEWPPLTLGEEEPPPLPKAVEVTIEVDGWGKLVRLYGLASGIGVADQVAPAPST